VLCSIPFNGALTGLLHATALILWDETPMVHCHAIEAVDSTLLDLTKQDQRLVGQPFGGKVIVFGGNFRQILPVVQRGSAADAIGASLRRSQLWGHLRVHQLTSNMRVQRLTGTAAVEQHLQWLLDLGSSTLPQDPELGIRVPGTMAMDLIAPSRQAVPCATGMHVRHLSLPERCR